MLVRNITGYSESNFLITPVTSVDNFLCINASDACVSGGGSINTVLGIDESIDVNTFDPVANKGDGGINDYLYEKGNQLTALAFALQNLSNDLNTTTDTTEDYFKAIAEELELSYEESNGIIDIEDESFINKVISPFCSKTSILIFCTICFTSSKVAVLVKVPRTIHPSFP